MYVLQAYWTNTVHAVLLVATGTAAVGLLPFLYFGFHWYWQRFHIQQTTSATPPAAAAGMHDTKSQAGELGSTSSYDSAPTETACCLLPEKQNKSDY